MTGREETKNQNKDQRKDQRHAAEQFPLQRPAGFVSAQLCGAKAQSAASRDRDHGADVGGGRRILERANEEGGVIFIVFHQKHVHAFIRHNFLS